MKNFSKLLLLLLLAGIVGSSKSQTSFLPIDTLPGHEFCGATPEYAQKMNILRTQLQDGQNPPQTSPYKYVIQAAFPPGLVEQCGSFNVYYEDYLTAPEGFAAPGALGLQRRNTLCAVLNYIESRIDFNGATIDLFVNQSFSAANPYTITNGTLAFAGSEYPPGFTTTPGIYNGYAFDHITTGIDPNTTTYDINMTVNFHQYFYFGAFQPVFFYNDFGSLQANNCGFDLFSVLLHEITHGMGWASFVTEDTGAGNIAINGNSGSVYTNAFSRFDSLFLYRGDILTGAFTKLVDATVPQIDPLINTITDPLRQNNIWLYDNGAPFNQPIYSGDFYGFPVASGSLISHLNFNMLSFRGMSQFSPGYQSPYVMGPFFEKNEMRRDWTIPEMRALLAMGYTLTPIFGASTSINGTDPNIALLLFNSPAYRTNPATQVTESNALVNFAEIPIFDGTLQNDNTPALTTLSQHVFSVATLPDIADLNGDPISIMPGSLFGIRGVSSGGNNHNLLTIVGGTIITYTPVPGYRGIAQFGFYLWDGHERGAFKTYTINVTQGTLELLLLSGRKS